MNNYIFAGAEKLSPITEVETKQIQVVSYFWKVYKRFKRDQFTASTLLWKI